MVERRLLRPLAGRRQLPRRRRDRVGGRAPVSARRGGAARVVPSPRLLAGGGHAARSPTAPATVGLRSGPVAGVGMSSAGFAEQAKLADGAIDRDFWRARRVLLTGHTGFKGPWLALWLQGLGARATGVALALT